jgi:transcriptional regulator with XRE-family HTH domain
MMNFSEIQTRLLLRIGRLIRNGELTERGFARSSGISQPHIHKVLKGTRNLSTAGFDLLLKSLGCSLLDFVHEDEMALHRAWDLRRQARCIEVPLRTTALGPGQPWPADRSRSDLYPIPCSLRPDTARLAIVRLNPDPNMRETLRLCRVAVIDLTSQVTQDATSLYAVDRGEDVVLRRVRRGSNRLYLISDQNPDCPLLWEAVPKIDSRGNPAIRGRVIWLNELEPP